MKNTPSSMASFLAALTILSTAAGRVLAQDWPQWRGPGRDGKAAAFNPPKTWPKTFNQKWKVTVGEGVATPALVGDRLYVFSRQDGNEITRALDAVTGKELWQEKYEALGASGAAQSFSGPRSSPTVADGKVLTLGVRGMLSCLDAGTGNKVWRKDEFQAYPRFHPSSSPLIVDGLCIAQLGGDKNGALVAYQLGTGDQKWKWNGSSPTYASPTLLTVDGTKLIVAQTEATLVAVRVADGKLAWESAPAGPGGGEGGGRGGGGRDYKAATPIVDGSTIITAGRGIKALKLEKRGEAYVTKELWSNTDKSVQFNTPVLKNGLLYGLTGGNELFCLNAQNGQTLWSAPATPAQAEAASTAQPAQPAAPAQPAQAAQAAQTAQTAQTAPAEPAQAAPAAQPAQPAQAAQPAQPGQPGPGGPGGRGRGGRGGGGGGGGGRGYGSIVDAGSVLLALTPASELIAFQPSDKAYVELARIKVADSQTHAHPIVSGNRIFIKDKESVTLLTLE